MIVERHQCEYGLIVGTNNGNGELKPALKPTGFMGNSWFILEALSKKCNGDHEHNPILGRKVAASAAIYPRELCEAMCYGLQKQKEYDKTMGLQSIYLRGKGLAAKIGEDGEIHEVDLLGSLMEAYGSEGVSNKDRWQDRVHEEPGGVDIFGSRPQDGREIYNEELAALLTREHGAMAWDDVSGKELNPIEVINARKLEMEYFEKLGVYTRVPREHQRRTGGKVI